MVGGPEPARLQRIAADAGVSHPAILHHSGSREGLVQAMVLNGLARLQTQFLKGWPSLKEPDIEGVLERFYEVASAPRSRAYARVADSVGTGVKTMRSGILSPAARRMHAGRVRRAHDEGRRPPELEESLFAAAFLAIVVLGDSLFGSSVRRAVGLSSSSEQKRRFQRWLAGGY